MIPLATVLKFLGISAPAPEQIAQIEMFIELVIAEIEAYTGAIINPIAITGEMLVHRPNFDYSWIPKLQIRNYKTVFVLENRPVSGVIVTTADGSTVSGDNYKVDEGKGLIFPFGGFCGTTVAYNAGYATLPSDLLLVALQGIKQYFVNGGATSQGSGNVRSKKLDRFSVNYGATNEMYASAGSAENKTYLLGNTTILNKYKRWQIWG